jgi:hypothetical protein
MVSNILTFIQVMGVLGGVVFSVWSFNATQQLEVSKPFLELRLKLYTEAAKVAAVLANEKSHAPDEIDAAKKRFRDLYVVELSMVEGREVEKQMKALAAKIAPELMELTPAQGAAYDLAHALRDSFASDWRVSR